MAERTLELAGLALSTLLLLRFAPPAVRSWRIYAGTRKRRLADAGPTEIVAPFAVQAILDQLRELGFSRIGERYVELPGRGPVVEWTWADQPGDTYVSVVASRVIGALMSCYTAFADWAWLQTNFPRGETIDRQNYVAEFVETSPRDAVATHRAAIARLRPLHGAPRPVRTMADSLRMDVEYRTRHGGVTLRRLTFRIMAPTFAAAGLAIICALLLLLGR
jgi:hypothetical protein